MCAACNVDRRVENLFEVCSCLCETDMSANASENIEMPTEQAEWMCWGKVERSGGWIRSGGGQSERVRSESVRGPEI